MDPRPAEVAAAERAYSSDEAVRHYAEVLHLFEVETWLFARFVPPDEDVVDLGVGAGRTTPALSARARSYIANDVTPAMVTAFSHRFPDLAIWEGDAVDLSRFEDASVDVVVFSFNGVDHLTDEVRRHHFYGECRRILREGGRLILSRHNVRCLLERPRVRSGSRRRVRVHARLEALRASVPLLRGRVASSAFRRGHGLVRDPNHGGMVLAMATPRHAMAELTGAGFHRVVGPFSDTFPDRFRALASPWYYLVALR